MTTKNEDIHLFIIEEERARNRERALKEMALREKLRQPSEELKKALQGYPLASEELTENEVTSPNEDRQNQSIGPIIERLELGNHEKELFKAGVFGYRLQIELGISSALAVFSFISIIILLQIETLLNQNLHPNGLQVLKGVTPYWIAINAALGIFWVLMIARNILHARK